MRTGVIRIDYTCHQCGWEHYQIAQGQNEFIDRLMDAIVDGQWGYIARMNMAGWC
jgi:hypothetical protein